MDTGADLSVLPASPSFRKAITSTTALPVIAAANKGPIPAYGWVSLIIDIGFGPCPWTFLVAGVDQPILGADFLSAHAIGVFPSSARLTRGSAVVTGSRKGPSFPTVHRISPSDQSAMTAMVKDEFPSLATADFTKCQHSVRHHISTTGPPVFARPRRLDPTKLRVAKAEFDRMLKAGIIRPSASPYASPLHMVMKPDGSWRPCGDFRRLNASTNPDRYPLPHTEDFVNDLGGASVFSKLDLVKGFFHVPVAEEDIPKTAVTTPFGLFEFLRMPFGLCNAPQTFQRFMNTVLFGLEGVFVYVDDILLATPDLPSHVALVRKVCGRLVEYGLAVNISKCLFAVPELTFLGNRINAHGIRPLSDRTSSIEEFPAPRDRTGLQRFLGFVNYYRRFLPKAAQVLAPLYSLLQLPKFVWTPQAQVAFVEVKAMLHDAVSLSFYDPSAPLALTTDASDLAVGAVLEQLVDGHWQPLGFHSHRLSSAESNYDTFDRELLAIKLAIEKFHFLLEGRMFSVYTDHKPLTSALSSSTVRTPRRSRHLSFISEYTSDIRHVSGKDNSPADALSRISAVSAVVQEPALADLALAQAADPSVDAHRSSSGLRLVARSLPGVSAPLLVDTSTGVDRPVVPKCLQKKIFDANHSLGHPGSRATRHRILSRFVWKGAATFINQMVRSCHACQVSKVHRHVKAPLLPYPTPSGRFQVVHVDIVGPFPEKQGFKYLLTCVDRFTRFPVAIPMPNITAQSVLSAFLAGWVSFFGAPLEVITDRGRQFTSQLWKVSLAELGIVSKTTTAYHPQSNGMVERFHRQLKSSLKARLPTDGCWVSELPLVLLALRASLKTDLGASCHDLVFGEPLRLPGQMVAPPTATMPPDEFACLLRQSMSRLRAIPPAYHGTPVDFVPPALASAEFVYVCTDAVTGPLQPPYTGPYRVLHRGSKSFLLDLRSRADRVSVDRLKPAYWAPVSPSQALA